MSNSFRYFMDPVNFTRLEMEKKKCSLCGQLQFCIPGRYFPGSHSLERVCLECIKKGLLKGTGTGGVLPDVIELENQIRDLHPHLPEQQIFQRVRDITDKLEFSTPPVPSHQPWLWPAHCGDYCRFIRIAGKKDYDRLSQGGNGKQVFEWTLYGDLINETDIDEIWNNLPDEINDIFSLPPVVAYLFKCHKCGSIFTLWDDSSQIGDGR